jgi:C4-dicarboxylate-specific signal transduction histidine kinase
MELKDKIYNFKIIEKTEALEAKIKKEKLIAESQELLDKAKHMASLGIMASGITHEINQPLNAIMIDAQTLLYKDDLEKVLPDSYRKRIQYIVEATERISDIIKHIRSYWIHNDWIDKKEFEVNQTITKAVALVNQQVKGHGIILKVRLSSASVFVFGTPISLEQTIINLIVNSIHALDSEQKKQKIIMLTTIVKGEFVHISIQDNGPGISDSIAHRIFEPFFIRI